MRRYSAVLFDLFGVILDTDKIITNILYPSLLAPTLSLRDVKDKYHRFLVAEIERDMFWKDLVEGDYRDVEENFLDSFPTGKGFPQVIEKIHDSTKTAVVSMVPKYWGHYLSRKFGFENLFDAVVFSGDHKMAKSSTGMFELPLNELAVEPENCIYIDDKLENLIRPHELGIQSVWYKRNETGPGQFQPDFVVTSLEEVYEIALGD